MHSNTLYIGFCFDWGICDLVFKGHQFSFVVVYLLYLFVYTAGFPRGEGAATKGKDGTEGSEKCLPRKLKLEPFTVRWSKDLALDILKAILAVRPFLLIIQLEYAHEQDYLVCKLSYALLKMMELIRCCWGKFYGRTECPLYQPLFLAKVTFLQVCKQFIPL